MAKMSIVCLLRKQLLHCERIAGGWYAVVMAKVEGSPLQLTVDKPVKESFKQVVTKMHEESYVHGDLRPQNILVVNDRVCVLDFDWVEIVTTLSSRTAS